jgi:D-xylose 1-dehydrogenase (NADP+, D-xylono-1,5-lactone-forming)
MRRGSVILRSTAKERKMKPEALRWGILGTGNMARQFCEGVAGARRCRLAAVGSRLEQSARSFAEMHHIDTACASYERILSDPRLDAIYISLPNSMHHEWAIKALSAGKHVLCEKPLAASAAQAREMFDAAERAGRVLVEAFMYRAHPLTHAVLDAVRAGAIGELKLLRTSFCYRTMRIDGNIRFDAALAGGALMDIGCYCTSFALLLAGDEPQAACAAGRLHPSGVDEMAAGVLRFARGLVCSFTCGMGVQADNTAYVCGSEGYIEVPVPWKPGRKSSYTIARGTPPRMDGAARAQHHPPREVRMVETDLELYALEADDFAATVLDGKAPMISAHESLTNMRLLDDLRRQLGVRF